MKDKFIRSSFILLVGGVITKIFGLFIKIILARSIDPVSLGNYMLIFPAFLLLLTISQLGVPSALTKLIAEEKRNNKNLVFTVLFILLLFDVVIILVIYFIAPILGNNLFHDKNFSKYIILFSLIIPFTTISSICRSYFIGKETMLPCTLSDVGEDIIKLIIIIIGVPIIIKNKLDIVVFLILINIITEIISIFIYIYFIPKKFTKFAYNNSYSREVLRLGIPSSTGRIISSLGYFLEPIILTSSLIRNGYSSFYIKLNYGILSGYVIPLILLPSFFTTILSQALLPSISKDYVSNNYLRIKSNLKLTCIFSILIGIIASLCFLFIPNVLLKFIYNASHGSAYIRYLALFCIFKYLEAPFTSCLMAMGKNKDVLISNTLGIIVRTSLIYILSFFNIGIWNLIIAISINIVIIFLYQGIKIKSYLN